MYTTRMIVNSESMKDKLKRLLETEENTDCTFVFPHPAGHEIIIRGHQFQLALASPHFRTVFYQNQESEIEINDVEPGIFMILMQIIYLQEPKIESPIDAILLYTCAQKYEVKDVVKYVREYMLTNCSPKNSLILFECAKVYKDHEIEKKCLEFFSDSTMEVIQSEYFAAAHPEIINKLFKMEYLAINSEQSLAEALDLYASVNAGEGIDVRRDLMGALSSIRFLTLDIDHILSTKLLSDTEKIVILKDLRGIAPATMESLPNLSLNRAARFNRNEFETNLRAIIYCKLVNGRPKYLVNARYWNRMESEDRKMILAIVKHYQHEMLQLYNADDINKLRDIFKKNDILGVHRESKVMENKDSVSLRDSDSN